MNDATGWPKDALALIEEQVERLAAGKVNQATARCDAKVALRESGHWNLGEGDQLDEIIEINCALRQLWRQHTEGDQDVILDMWPAQELFAVFRHNDESTVLKKRWLTLKGRIFDDRMIALKDDPIWTAMSDFGFPFPPFTKESSGRVRDVTREEAMKFGLIDLHRRIKLPGIPRPKGLFV